MPYSTHNGVATVVPAKPPHGCDKDQYVSKISGAVVAIMRGGGCSFGEKITLAKELGARGVIIVDDDDSDSPSRLQRLMVDDDQEDELGDVFPVVMTIKGFWAENFDVKEGNQGRRIRPVARWSSREGEATHPHASVGHHVGVCAAEACCRAEQHRRDQIRLREATRR